MSDRDELKASQQALAARERWRRWRADVEAAERGDPEAAARVAAWDEVVARRKSQIRTPGLSLGPDGRYRLRQLPGQSWGSRQGAHSALKTWRRRKSRPPKQRGHRKLL